MKGIPPSSAGLLCYLLRKEYSKGILWGLFFFCLTIYPLIQQLKSEFRLFYLDDGIMGGCLPDILLRDLENLKILASDLGLRLNQDKSQLFCSDPATRREILSTVPGLHVIGGLITPVHSLKLS